MAARDNKKKQVEVEVSENKLINLQCVDHCLRTTQHDIVNDGSNMQAMHVSIATYLQSVESDPAEGGHKESADDGYAVVAGRKLSDLSGGVSVLSKQQGGSAHAGGSGDAPLVLLIHLTNLVQQGLRTNANRKQPGMSRSAPHNGYNVTIPTAVHDPCIRQNTIQLCRNVHIWLSSNKT